MPESQEVLTGKRVRRLTAADLGVAGTGGSGPGSISQVRTVEELAERLLIPLSLLQGWLDGIRRKKQAIFYGPPGTGKTLAATSVASFLAGNGDGLVETVQFHPSFSYEDFIEGRRPQTDSKGRLQYPVLSGRFQEFCERASQKRGPCVMVIDEFNRANLSQVLGELLFLLEYRNQTLTLPGSGKHFSIPGNVYILGTMNTADRSIAVADLALRRRFTFLRIPANPDVLRAYHAKRSGLNVNNLIDQLKIVNAAINDPNLEIGPSYFMSPDLKVTLEGIWRTEIEPYLEEVFADALDRVEPFRWEQVKGKIGF